MTVQELIDELNEIPDKSWDIEIEAGGGERILASKIIGDTDSFDSLEMSSARIVIKAPWAKEKQLDKLIHINKGE
jgi:hypothetical protein